MNLFDNIICEIPLNFYAFSSITLMRTYQEWLIENAFSMLLFLTRYTCDPREVNSGYSKCYYLKDIKNILK